MVIDEKTKPKAEDFIEEMKNIVLSRFPEARFEVHRMGPRDFRIHAVADFLNAFEILDITADRTADILVEHDIYIGVLPLNRRIDGDRKVIPAEA